MRRQNMKVRINATGDTIVMKFLRPSPDVKLEGYILGYGSSMFSKQLIELPENGEPYETELDAEPKYLVAVQPIPANDVKKHCTGKVNLEKPLHLVIGSVSPTAVLLSWGNHLKTPYEGNVMNECLEDGFYTIRYRERNRKWIYQTCPTSDTVIDNLKPNTPYEFGVRSNKDDRSGMWSKPVVHNTNMGNKNAQKPYKLRNPLAKPLKPHAFFPPRPALHNGTRPRLSTVLKKPGFPGAPRTSFAPPESRQESSVQPTFPRSAPLEKGNSVRTDLDRPADPPTPALPHFLPTKAPPTVTTPLYKIPSGGESLHVQTTKTPSSEPEKNQNPAAFGQSRDGSSLLRSALANERARANTWGQDSNRNPLLPLHSFDPAASTVGSMRPSPRKPLFPFSKGLRQPSNSAPTSGILGVNRHLHRGVSPPKPALWSRPGLGKDPSVCVPSLTCHVSRPSVRPSVCPPCLMFGVAPRPAAGFLFLHHRNQRNLHVHPDQELLCAEFTLVVFMSVLINPLNTGSLWAHVS
uniref:Target of Nesh-SH3-like n=1 Tax=Stegastes partitus TaxID=144197 RepID=A0A3B4YVW6_9TELE